MPVSVAINLTPSQVVVAPEGPPAQLNLMVKNGGHIVDQFRVEVEGLEPSWYTIPVPTVSLFPGDSHAVPIQLQAPRGQKLLAGTRQFTVRVTSRDNVQNFAVAQGTIEIPAVTGWSVSMQPQRVVGRRGNFRVSLTNTGNSDLELGLAATDAEQALSYSFSDAEPRIAPLEAEQVSLDVKSKRLKLVGMVKPYVFTVTAHPVTLGANLDAQQSSEVKKLTGEFHYKPYLRSWRMPVILGALVALLIVFLAWRPDKQPCSIVVIGGLLCPKPAAPQVTLFVSDRSRVTPGESVTLRWRVKDGVKGVIAEDNTPVDIAPDGTGSTVVTPDTDRTYTLCVSNATGDTTCSDKVFITVQQSVAGAPTVAPGQPTIPAGGAGGAAGGGGAGGDNGGGGGGGAAGGGGGAGTGGSGGGGGGGAGGAGGGDGGAAAPTAQTQTQALRIVPPTRAAVPANTQPPAQGGQPGATPTPFALSCDTTGNVDGEAVPSIGHLNDTINVRASGFKKGEPIFLGLTTPSGNFRAPDTPISGAVKDDGTLDIAPITVTSDFTQDPGQWTVTFLGATSNHRSVVAFCIAP